MATGERSEKTRYYITSLENTNPEEIANAIRQHWSIENNLHWQLDVTFREDYSKKVQNAARNFSAVTKMALTILKNDKVTKGSMNLKRLKAGWDEKYLSTLFTGQRILMRRPCTEALYVTLRERALSIPEKETDDNDKHH